METLDEVVIEAVVFKPNEDQVGYLQFTYELGEQILGTVSFEREAFSISLLDGNFSENPVAMQEALEIMKDNGLTDILGKDLADEIELNEYGVYCSLLDNALTGEIPEEVNQKSYTHQQFVQELEEAEQVYNFALNGIAVTEKGQQVIGYLKTVETVFHNAIQFTAEHDMIISTNEDTVEADASFVQSQKQLEKNYYCGGPSKTDYTLRRIKAKQFDKK